MNFINDRYTFNIDDNLMAEIIYNDDNKNISRCGRYTIDPLTGNVEEVRCRVDSIEFLKIFDTIVKNKIGNSQIEDYIVTISRRETVTVKDVLDKIENGELKYGRGHLYIEGDSYTVDFWVANERGDNTEFSSNGEYIFTEDREVYKIGKFANIWRNYINSLENGIHTTLNSNRCDGIYYQNSDMIIMYRFIRDSDMLDISRDYD